MPGGIFGIVASFRYKKYIFDPLPQIRLFKRLESVSMYHLTYMLDR